MIKRFCYCKHCGNKIYNLKSNTIFNYLKNDYDCFITYHCSRCDNTDDVNIKETYLEDNDDIKEENNYTALDILNEIKEYVKLIDYGEPYTNRYALQINNIIHPVDKETYNRWDRWLNYDNTK